MKGQEDGTWAPRVVCKNTPPCSVCQAWFLIGHAYLSVSWGIITPSLITANSLLLFEELPFGQILVDIYDYFSKINS